MYCKYCGSEIDDDAEFCPECGKPQSKVRQNSSGQQPHHRGGRYQLQKKKKHVWPIVVATAIVTILVIMGFFAAGDYFQKRSLNQTVDLVQNGYLGEYTDLTVMTIFDRVYSRHYDSKSWTGFEADSGDTVVEAKYYNKNKPETAAVVQFTMLDERCFRVSYLHDPEYETESDFEDLIFLHMHYFAALLMPKYGNSDEIPDLEFEVVSEFLEPYNGITLSSARYGASADYTGGRTNIGARYGYDQKDVTIGMVMGFLELLDIFDSDDIMADWEDIDWDSEEIFEDPAPLQTEPIALETLPPTHETQPPVIETQAPETYPVEVPQEENRLPSGPYGDNIEPAFEQLTLVLMGINDFKLDVPHSYVNINNITQMGDTFCDPPFEPLSFAAVDLDHNGTDEVIVQFSMAGEHLMYMVLRYQDGMVIGTEHNLNGFLIGQDGNVVYPYDDGTYEFFYYTFENNIFEFTTSHVTDPEGFFLDWDVVQWHTFDELY